MRLCPQVFQEAVSTACSQCLLGRMLQVLARFIQSVSMLHQNQRWCRRTEILIDSIRIEARHLFFMRMRSLSSPSLAVLLRSADGFGGLSLEASLRPRAHTKTQARVTVYTLVSLRIAKPEQDMSCTSLKLCSGD